MTGVWGILGYERVAAAAAETIRDGSHVAVIQGPPGVGKSWLARGIGALWESADGSAVVAQGDVLHSDAPLYPLGFAMAGLSSGWRVSGIPIAETARAAESLAGTAGIITGTVQTISKLRPKRRRARTMFLGDAEQHILFDLERLSRRRPLLIIADNLHWWDPASLEFLGRMREPRMRDAFPFLAEARVLAVQTTEPYQHVAHPIAHGALLAPGTARFFDLSRVPREGFAEVLVALGAPSAAATESAATIYALTGGHLALAKRCARHLEAGDMDSVTAIAESAEFLAELLTERIRSLGAIGEKAVELLRIAAVLGLRFRRDEVTCAWGGDSFETTQLLRYLRDHDVLQLSDDAGWFVHDVYRQHFLEVDPFARTSLHEKLADCLRALSPADYEARCQNAVQAERPRDAATLGAQAALARQRDGLAWQDVSPATMSAIEDGGLIPLVERFARALEHLNGYRYAACLAELDALPHALPTSLVAEADYVRATCLMSTRSNEDSARGRSMLEAWAHLVDDEPELGVRMMQLCLYSLVLLPEKEQGRMLEGRIKDVLRRRVAFDQAAEDAMYTLDRCSGGLYEPEIALVRVGEAVRHFGPRDGQLVVRRPVEYYRCLVNNVALLIVNARYEEAREVASVLDDLVAQYADGVFPRLDYHTMNRLLAEHRLGQVDIAEVVRRQREIAATHAVPGDPFFVENALACYLALAGEVTEAVAIHDRLLEDLESRQDPEVAILYLIRANRSAATYVAGDHARAAAEWERCGELVELIAYPIGRCLVRRHQLLGEVMRSGAPMTGRELDEVLVRGRRPEFGPLWDQVGRGFWIPEIEWWH